MPDLSTLPTLNASLNGLSATFLVGGYWMVRQGRIGAHRACMLVAFACSVLFLVSYLFYHSQVGSMRFQGTGTLRTFYLTVLLTHSVLAAAVPILAAITDAGVAGSIRQACGHRTLDPAHLALRFRHRSPGVLDAVPLADLNKI